jgi:hypothetical protein
MNLVTSGKLLGNLKAKLSRVERSRTEKEEL